MCAADYLILACSLRGRCDDGDCDRLLGGPLAFPVLVRCDEVKTVKITFSAYGNLRIKWNIFDYASIFERPFKTKNVA